MAYKIHTTTLDDNGQQPCARADRCLESTSIPGPDGRENQPTLGYRALCDSDRALALRCIEALPGHHWELGDRIGDRANSHGPKVSGSRNPPIPINLTFDELRVEMVNIIASWAGRIYHLAHLAGIETERSLADRARYGAPLTANPQQPFTRMCETLAAHLDALLLLPPEPMTRILTLTDADDLPEGTPVHRDHWTGYAEALIDLSGADAARDMFRLNARCRWVLGHTSRDEKIPGRCLACDQLDVLIRPDSDAGLSDHAECTACGTRYVGAEYANLIRDAYEREIARQHEKMAG